MTILTDVHYVILFCIVNQPVVEKRQLSIGGSDVGSACGQEPADDGPARYDVRAKHFVTWMDDAADVANEIASQRLTFGHREVLSLKPVLVALMHTKLNLQHNRRYYIWVSSRQITYISEIWDGRTESQIMMTFSPNVHPYLKGRHVKCKAQIPSGLRVTTI